MDALGDLPQDFSGVEIEPGDLTVIAWVVAHHMLTKGDNRRKNSTLRRWRGLDFSGTSHEKMRRYVVGALEARAYARGPSTPHPTGSGKGRTYVFASSGRNGMPPIASGLGTFGCVTADHPLGRRCGSVPLSHASRFPPTPTLRGSHAYCLFHSRRPCKKCISRCPVGA